MKLIIPVAIMFLIILLSAIAVLPLTVYVIKDVAQLYGVDFIIALSKEILFGTLLILSLVRLTIKEDDVFKAKEKDDEDEYGLVKGLKTLFTMAIRVLLILLSWGIAYFIHLIQFE